MTISPEAMERAVRQVSREVDTVRQQTAPKVRKLIILFNQLSDQMATLTRRIEELEKGPNRARLVAHEEMTEEEAQARGLTTEAPALEGVKPLPEEREPLSTDRQDIVDDLTQPEDLEDPRADRE